MVLPACRSSRWLISSEMFVYGPLTRYVKLWVAHAPGMPGTFSTTPRVSDPDMHHGTCVTHVPWCMLGSLTEVSFEVVCGENIKVNNLSRRHPSIAAILIDHWTHPPGVRNVTSNPSWIPHCWLDNCLGHDSRNLIGGFLSEAGFFYATWMVKHAIHFLIWIKSHILHVRTT